MLLTWLPVLFLENLGLGRMNLRNRVESLRDSVRSMATEAETTIDPLRLSAELDSILDQSDRFSDRIWRKHQYRMELWKETRLEMSRAAIGFGQGAIRALILINGGASIAVMTFIGNFGSEQAGLISSFSLALLLFSMGVAAAALVAGCSYVTQFFYESSSGKLLKAGNAFHCLAVLAAAVSFSLFVWALLTAYFGFEQVLEEGNLPLLLSD